MDNFQDGGAKEKSKINEYMNIFKKIVPKFGTLTPIKYSSYNSRRKKVSKKKLAVKRPINGMYSTMNLIINLLLVLSGKRKACLVNSQEMQVTEAVITAFKEMIDMFDGTLAFEWVCFLKNKFYNYQIIFYNTHLISQKIVRDTLDSYDPNLKHASGCCCTSCNGGPTYTLKLKSVLDYLCDPLGVIDYDNYDYYSVNFDIKYKGQYYTPFFYQCAKKPSIKILKKKFMDIKPVLDALGAELDIRIFHNGTTAINKKTYKKIK
jgi:hypothetical protein